MVLNKMVNKPTFCFVIFSYKNENKLNNNDGFSPVLHNE